MTYKSAAALEMMRRCVTGFSLVYFAMTAAPVGSNLSKPWSECGWC